MPNSAAASRTRLFRRALSVALYCGGLLSGPEAVATEPDADPGQSASAAVTAVEQPAVWLPTDWPAGTQMRYALRWERAFPAALATALEPALASGMQGEQSATVQVRVLRREAESGVLRWQPRLEGAEPDPATDLALAMWRLMLAQTLEIRWQSGADGALEYRVHDIAALQRRVWPRLAALARHAGVDPRCDGSQPRAELLCRLHTEAGLNEWLLGPVQGFFACVGMENTEDAVAEWSEPHPAPAIADAVQVHHRYTWLPAQADGRVRIQLHSEPDAAQVSAWVRSQLDPDLLAHAPLQQWLAQFQFRTTAHCEMDPHSGWPETVDFAVQGGSDPDQQTRESAQLRRLPEAN